MIFRRREMIAQKEVEPIYTKTLPTGVWAAFDKRNLVDTTNMVWADSSGNGNDMALSQSGSGSIWDSRKKCIICNVGNYVTGVVTNETLTTGQFIPKNSYSFSALVEWNKDAQSNVGDMLLDMQAITGTTTTQYSFHYINRSSRYFGYLTYWGLSASGNPKTITSTSAIPLTGVHLLTWTFNMSSSTGVMTFYCDGQQIGAINIDRGYSVRNKTPDLRFLARNTINNSQDWRFYGKCYALNVYNKVLTASEVAQCVEFYDERYKQYSPS